ncbi:MAG: hypothetical protein E6R06_22840 [Mycobacterium sp.]|jgi:hypothetical protein|nr:MAG: hypothetical protein E6R06_22840 [Mycobacterium sp.]
MNNRQDSRRRAERAAQLRAMGRTWAEIADTLGYRTRQAAQQAVGRLHDRTAPESVEQLRRTEAEELRLRRAVLHERFWEAKRNRDDDTLAMLNRELDRVAARQAKLFGLDAPDRQQVDVQVTQTPTALLDRLEAALLEQAAQHQNQLPAPIIDAETEEIA